MKKIAMIAGMPAVLLLLIWQGYRLVAPEPPSTVSRQPQPMQVQGDWDEQISAIKREYGLGKRPMDISANNPARFAAVAVHEPQAARANGSGTGSVPMEDASTAPSASTQADEQTSVQEDMFDHTAQAFWQEPVDEVWAQHSSQQIADYFARLSLEGNAVSALNNVECRSSRCKIEVVHEGQRAFDDFALAFPVQMAGSLHNFMFQTEALQDGRIALVMYVEK